VRIKPLGILYKNGKIVNHRTILKIVLNPILKCFGLYIGSRFIDNKFKYYKLVKGNINLNIFKNYYNSLFTCNEYDYYKKNKK
jgi:hypothetical protein